VERYLKTLEAFTGESLRRVREMRGISLFDLCSLTKIRQTYVDYIETENFKGLPAAVYVRGFVRLMADALQLPADRVTTDFMARYKQASTPTPARKT
jgi:cytoskeletal protein RodZ